MSEFMTPKEVADMYREILKRQWGETPKPVPGDARMLADVLRDYLERKLSEAEKEVG